MTVMEVAAVPAVVHAEVGASCCWTEVVTVVIIISVRTVQVPGVCATIGGIECRASKEEVVTVWIAGIDAEVPVACVPIEGAVEIAGGNVCLPLYVEQDVAQVAVAALPVVAIYIVVARHTHQVVEVNLVGGFILLVCQVQFVSHLVGQEQRLVASLFVTHCLARCCYRQHT
jgi:hypothetical protein